MTLRNLDRYQALRMAIAKAARTEFKGFQFSDEQLDLVHSAIVDLESLDRECGYQKAEIANLTGQVTGFRQAISELRFHINTEQVTVNKKFIIEEDE